ncbi:MAG: D-Ala-D-Ala carboxypeptidase family metallohydrolase [Alphaproteobacteria bacterium]
MKLSEHFTLGELTRSRTADRLGIDNSPTKADVERMRALCVAVLEPIRNVMGPVRVNSGFRSAVLNLAIGGAKDSQHMLGEAADIECADVSNLALARWIESSSIDFDQLILEFYRFGDPSSGWVHVSHRAEANRREVLTATRVGGAVQYLPGLPTGGLM